MILKDGGVLIIPEKTKEKWIKMYPNVHVQNVIECLDEQKMFATLSKKGALKLINKVLREVDEDV